MRRGIVVTIAAVAALALAAGVFALSRPEPRREAWLWPFATTSPWNMPIGDGAEYESADDERTANLIDPEAHPWVNAGEYSVPIFKASEDDPLATVHEEGQSEVQYRIPPDAEPAPGSDSSMFVVDPTGRWVDETWRTEGAGTEWTAEYHVRNDLTSSGWGAGGVRAAGASGIGGIIREWELDDGHIRHAIALSLSDFQLRSGPVWPATNEDSGAEERYQGENPIGTLAAIPPTVDVTELGLSRSGVALARALQDYGGYVVDRTVGFIVKAEPSLEGSPLLEDLRDDLDAIRAELRVVTNNGPDAVGGGGRARTGLAPPLRK